MKLIIKRVMREQQDKHWKPTELWRVEILTIVELADGTEWGFLTCHKPIQKIGDAVEEHLRLLKKARKKSDV